MISTSAIRQTSLITSDPAQLRVKDNRVTNVRSYAGSFV